MKNILKYKGYLAKIEYDSEDMILCGKIEGITDLVDFYSETAEGIKSEFEKAVDDYLQFCIEHGKDPEKPFKGNFNVRIPEDIHREAYIKANLQGKTLNQFVKESITEKLNKSSDAQNEIIPKIELTLKKTQDHLEISGYNKDIFGKGSQKAC